MDLVLAGIIIAAVLGGGAGGGWLVRTVLKHNNDKDE